MKTSDLRIGNLIEVDGFYYPVLWINKVGVELKKIGWVNAKYIKPIRLYPYLLAILKGVEYKKIDEHQECYTLKLNKDVEIAYYSYYGKITKASEVFFYYPDDKMLFYKQAAPLYYHKLQNLYHELTGRELKDE